MQEFKLTDYSGTDLEVWQVSDDLAISVNDPLECSTVYLTPKQVRQLRDELTQWLRNTGNEDEV